MDEALQFHPGQQNRISAQAQALEGFCDKRMVVRMNMCIEMCMAEFLAQDHTSVGLLPSTEVYWLTEPLKFVTDRTHPSVFETIKAQLNQRRAHGWPRLGGWDGSGLPIHSGDMSRDEPYRGKAV